MNHLRAEDGSKNLLGPRIKALRKEKNLSQEKLMAQLQLLGMDAERGVIKRIENGTLQSAIWSCVCLRAILRSAMNTSLTEPKIKKPACFY